MKPSRILPASPISRMIFLIASGALALFTIVVLIQDFVGGWLLIPMSPYEHFHKSHGTESDATIPNIAHFVYVLGDNAADFSFNFSHFLSMYGAWRRWKPDTIYLHTNAPDDAIARASNGSVGKWNQAVLNMPSLVVRQVEAPTHAGNGVELNGLEHRSDFVRVKAVHELGGVYIDFDVHALRDLRDLRHSGFQAVVGRQKDEAVNSGTFMAAPGSKLTTMWVQIMNEVYDGEWVTHSNDVVTRVGEQLAAERGEVLIMERKAFAPGSWWKEDHALLFDTPESEPSHLDELDRPDTWGGLDDDNEAHALSDIWSRLQSYSSQWIDWSSTYLLHAFNAERLGGEHHENTPRYVLERRSNFARAVYPVARELYDLGIVTKDDLEER